MPLRPLDDWFDDWLDGHLIRHAKEGLPPADSEGEGVVLYATWKKLFRLRGVHDLDVATEASERLLAEPPRMAKDHFAQLLRHALDAYRLRGAAAGPGVDPNGREAAELASRDCPCRGTGLTLVYYGRPRAEGSKIPDRVAAYCTCPAGRWIERNHRERSPDIRRRMPDLADVLAGRSVWTARPGAHPAMHIHHPDDTP